MPTYSVAEAQRSFSDLVRRAEAGEEVIITHRGKMVSITARTPEVRAERLAPIR